MKTLPAGAVWDYYCERQGVPVGDAWLAETVRWAWKTRISVHLGIDVGLGRLGRVLAYTE